MDTQVLPATLVFLSWLIVLYSLVVAAVILPRSLYYLFLSLVSAVAAVVYLHYQINGAVPRLIDKSLVSDELIIGVLKDVGWWVDLALVFGIAHFLAVVCRTFLLKQCGKSVILAILLVFLLTPLGDILDSYTIRRLAPQYIFSGEIGSPAGYALWDGTMRQSVPHRTVSSASHDRRRGSVVLILIEGFSRQDLVGGAMPGLKSVAEANHYYPNVLAHQRQTNRGLYAVLCGDYPNLLSVKAKSDLLVSAATSVDCIPSRFKSEGYDTRFYQSSPLGYMSKGSFAKAVGFDKVLGQNDFLSDGEVGPWGVADHIVFNRVLDDLREGRSKFFSTILTTATHHPYWIGGSTGSRRDALAYTDEAVTEFILALREIDPAVSIVVTGDEAGVEDKSGVLPGWNHTAAILIAPLLPPSIIDTSIRAHIDIAPTMADLGAIEWPWATSLLDSVDTSRILYAANHFTQELYAVSHQGFETCGTNFDCQYGSMLQSLIAHSDRYELPHEAGILFGTRDITLKAQSTSYIYGRVVTDVLPGSALEMRLNVPGNIQSARLTGEMIVWDCNENLSQVYRVEFPVKVGLSRVPFTQISPNTCHKLLVRSESQVVDIRGVRASILDVSPTLEPVQAPAAKPVSHAGGTIDGEIYTNSLEAFEQRISEGFQFLEVDFIWTNDDVLVCGHDWNDHWLTSKIEQATSPSYGEWLNLRNRVRHPPCNISELERLLTEYPHVKLVTDIKYDNLKGLSYLAEMAPALALNLIPQVHTVQEYSGAIELGFSDVIFTLYRDSRPNAEVYRDIASLDLFAVTMPLWRMQTSSAHYFRSIGKRVYVHTLNEGEAIETACADWGVASIYTDLPYAQATQYLSEGCAHN
jgi:hypothetical protein